MNKVVIAGACTVLLLACLTSPRWAAKMAPAVSAVSQRQEPDPVPFNPSEPSPAQKVAQIREAAMTIPKGTPGVVEPVLTEDVADWLDARFPRRDPVPGDTLETLMYLGGQRSVAAYIRQRARAQVQVSNQDR